ncbi:MAG: NAD(P)-dependent oxidoreductase [Marinobacter sp.]
MSVVGLCGAGVMGRAAAGKLRGNGYQIIAYDVAGTALARIATMGAETAATPAEVARLAETVLMFLPGPEEVASCVTGKTGLLSAARQGGTIVDMSTVDPATTEAMAEAASAQGVGYLDAPVLGRPESVGAWALPVGGDAQTLERVRPVLEIVASAIYPMGATGAGNRVKLLNQLMFGAINAMTAEMMAIAHRMGLPPKLLYETITGSQAGTVSNLFKELGRRVAEDEYENATFTVNLLVKDVRLAADMACRHGAPPLLTRSVEFINEAAQVQGYGDADTAVMWKVLLKFWDKAPTNVNGTRVKKFPSTM